MKKILKKNAPKFLIVLALFISFLFYMNWTENETPTFTISEAFKQVDSEQEIVNEMTRQLTRSELATDYSLFNDVDYEQILMEERRTIKVEKAWFHQGDLQLIYSVDLLSEDKKELDVPYLLFEKMGLKAGGKRYDFDLPTMETNWLSKGFVHNYRLYRGINIRVTGSEQNYENLQNVMESGEIDQIVIDEPKLVHGSSEGRTSIDQMAIDLSLSTLTNEELERIELNQRADLGDGKSIEWKALVLYIDYSKLLFEIDTEQTLQGITLRVSKPSGEVYEDQVSVGRSEDGRYEVNVREFQEFPNEFSVEVTGMEFMGDGEPLTYTIPNETIAKGLTLGEGETESTEQKIGSKDGVNIFFEGLSNTDTYGEPDQDLLGILVGVEGVRDQQFNTWFHYVTKDMQNLKYNITGDSEDEVYQFIRGPLMEITDQSGTVVDPIRTTLLPTPEKEVQNILIERSFFEEANEINLKISHFPTHETVTSNKISFTLKGER